MGVTAALDETHALAASWVPSAQGDGRGAAEFPLQNLPFGVFSREGGTPRIGMAIGTEILDLHRTVTVGALGTLDSGLREALLAPGLNNLMARGRAAARAVRRAVHAILRDGAAVPRPPEDCLVPQAAARLHLPAAIGDYTDFYASIHHARNVGSMFRPDEPLLPNYRWVPIGYHGRASSVVAGGAGVRRPVGQLRDDGPAPLVRPTRALDYECELGFWVGAGNPLGEPISLDRAEEHLFGLGLLNDWSARDIQRWEYQPLGPFLSKSFATSVSPWVVTLDALEPFRVPAAPRGPDDPAPLPYLSGDHDRQRGGVAVELEVLLRSERMRAAGTPAFRVSASMAAGLYWTLAQLVTHHTSNGCNLRPGDLLASGTISGPEPESRGCLLERTWRGSEPLALPGGETRRFLEDGDEVILRGRCRREGFASIGFGECAGIVLPARAPA